MRELKSAPKEAEKRQFPGEGGTPPKCTCPPGTEFMGDKGRWREGGPCRPKPQEVVKERYTFPFTKDDDEAYQATFTPNVGDVDKGKINCEVAKQSANWE